MNNELLTLTKPNPQDSDMDSFKCNIFKYAKKEIKTSNAEVFGVNENQELF